MQQCTYAVLLSALRPTPLLACLQVKTDWASLIDNWAVRFLHEMDYTREAANAELFRFAACCSFSVIHAVAAAGTAC
jgi:hypothetical protein